MQVRIVPRPLCVLIAILGSVPLVAETEGTALVRHAPSINGTVEGSVQQMTGESVTLNGNAVVTGDLLVPGTPALRLNGRPAFGGTVQGSGSTLPANFTVTLNGNASLGRLVTRSDPHELPPVSAPPLPAGTRDVSLNRPAGNPGDFTTIRNLTLNGNVGPIAVPPGAYGSFTANGNSGFTLGVAGATEPAVYSFQRLTLNGDSTLRVVGPVVVSLAADFTANGNLGDPANPAWLVLRLANGDFTLNGRVAVNGYVSIPSGTVTINGNSELDGGVACDRLVVNGNGVLRLIDYRPSIALTAPPPGTVVAAPGSLSLQAAASDIDGWIQKVEFYANGTKVGEDDTVGAASYVFAFTSVPYGAYTLTAVATDNAGGTATSAPVSVIIDEPPTVSITAPAADAVVTAPGDIVIRAGAADIDGTVAKVEFYSGTTKIGESTAAPFQFEWTGAPHGNYSLTAVATDDHGISTTSAPVPVIVNEPPRASITGPASGALFVAPATVTLTASATDIDGSVVKVAFYDGAAELGELTAPDSPGGATYSLSLAFNPGAHSVTAIATDNLGAATTSAPVTFVVDAPPTAILTGPHAIPVGAGVALVATATDPDGSIEKVEFYRAGALIGTVTEPSAGGAYSFTDISGTAPGMYSYVARTYDNNGFYTDSAPISVQLLPTLPYISDFEENEHYTLGPLAGQLGWAVPQPPVTIDNETAYSGVDSILLDSNSPPAQARQTFAPYPGHPIVFVDFFAKPVAEPVVTDSTTFDVESARFAFLNNGAGGVLEVFDGDGTGGGIWQPTTFTASLVPDKQTQIWIRLTARLDFSRQTWDLYAGGKMVAADLAFIDKTATYFSTLAVRGDLSAASRIDYLFAGADNPLFADVNNDGIDDPWETAHGLSLDVNDRNLSPSGSGLTVVQAYLSGTDPNDYYNGLLPVLTSLVVDGKVGQGGLVSVKVTRLSDGAALANAPVTLAVTTGVSQIRATPETAFASQITVRTDSQGVAAGFVSFLNGGSDTLVATATSGTNAATISVSVSSGSIPTAGLRLWLDADAGVSAEASSKVSAWADQSGLGNNAVQTTDANQPTLVTSIVNGQSAVHFNGDDHQYFILPNLMNGATAGEAFIVLRSMEDQPGSNKGLWRMGPVNGGSFYPLAGGRISEDFASSTQQIFTPSVPISTFNLYDFSGVSGDWEARINGVLQYLDSTNTVGFRSDPAIGWNNVNADYDYFYGDIAEIIVYDRVLTDLEREAVGRYLEKKYSLPNIAQPAIPAGLQAAALSPTQVSLTWTDDNPADKIYTVERRSAGSDFAVVGETAGATAFVDPGAFGGLVYSYRIRSRNYAGDSPGYSNVVGVTTPESGTTVPLGPEAGIRLWLEGDGGITSTGSGQIRLWQDRNMPKLLGSQPSPGNAPVWTANGCNGRPVVHFNGDAHQYLAFPDVMGGATAGEAFIVLRSMEDQPGSNKGLWRMGPVNGGSFYPLAGGRISEDFASSTQQIFTPSFPITSFNLYDFFGTAGDWEAWMNGVLQYRNTTNTVGFRPDPALGWNNTNPDFDYFYGDIAAIVVFDRVLNPVERNAVSTYLQSKYGLTSLPAAPQAPQSMAGRAASSSEVRLSWNEPAMPPGVTYIIERQAGAGDFVAVGQVSDQLWFVDGGVSPGVAYTYRVKAENALGVSDYGSVVSVATPSGFALPTSNLRLWLKADAGIVTAGGKVAAWQDQSGRAMDASQTNASIRPTVVLDNPSGMPMVHFDGGSALNLPPFMTGAAAAELFIVIRASDAIPGSGQDARVLTWVNANRATNYPTQLGDISDGFGSSAANTFGAGQNQLTTLQIYNVTATDSGWTARLDGRAVFNKTSNSVTFTDTSFPPVIGADRSGAYYSLANWFVGDVAEVAVYDHPLSTEERLAAGAYFARKYDLPIQAPVAPTGIRAAPVSSGQVSLAWQGSDPSASYSIERAVAGGAFQEVTIVSGVTDYLDAGLASGTTYSYRIRAQNYGGQSDDSESATVTTSTFMPAPPENGMRLWLAPESLPATTANLQAWPDLSGSGNTAVQNASESQPQILANALNGRPVVRFNGRSSFLELPNVVSGATAAEVFLVLRAALPTASDGRFWTYGGLGYLDSDGQIHDGFASTTSHPVGSPPVDVTTAHIYNAVSSPTEWTARLDGRLLYATSANTVDTSDPIGGSVIGAVHSGAYYALGNWYSGDLAEVIVYDRVLSAAERESVEFYLNQKYGCSSADFTELNYFNFDSDGDGVPNAYESVIGTDSFDPSSGGTGIPDGWALANGVNPLDPDAAVADPSNDGVGNLEKFLRGLSPQVPITQDPAAPIDLRVFVPGQR